MKMIWVTDVANNNKIAVNTDHVVAIFPAFEGDHIGKTVIGLINGSIIVDESDVELVGILNGN